MNLRLPHKGISFANRTLLVSSLLILAVLIMGYKGHTFVGLLAAAASSLNGNPATLYFVPYEDRPLTVGQTAEIDININTRLPINAIGLTVSFPPDLLEIVGISKKKSFLDLWTEETSIQEELGQVHFSGGTTRKGGLEGIATALTLTVKAKKAGVATLSFPKPLILAYDGKGTPLTSTIHPYSYEILNPVSLGSGGSEASIAAPQTQPNAPSADFNDSGAITIVDMSILTLKILSPYDPRYDLDMDGNVGLSDLSILFVKMRDQ